MRSFVKEYFDNKDLDGLKKTITPDWSQQNTEEYIKLISPSGKDIYEIGAGIGRLLKPLSEKYNVSGCDASKAMVENQISGCNISYCSGDGEIPERDESNDFVFSVITFQHIPNTKTVEKYIEESYRILRPGGRLLFQILSSKEQEAELWTYHNPTLLSEYMLNVGFKKVESKNNGRWTIMLGEKND